MDEAFIEREHNKQTRLA